MPQLARHPHTLKAHLPRTTVLRFHINNPITQMPALLHHRATQTTTTNNQILMDSHRLNRACTISKVHLLPRVATISKVHHQADTKTTEAGTEVQVAV